MLLSAFLVATSGVFAMDTAGKCLHIGGSALAQTVGVVKTNRMLLSLCGTPFDNNSTVDVYSEVFEVTAAVSTGTVAILYDDVKPGLVGLAIAATVIAGNAAYKKAKQNGYCAIQ